MLRYCVRCKEIFGCVKEDKVQRECTGCREKEDCPLNTIYPREDVSGGICYPCASAIIWEEHRKRNGIEIPPDL